MLFNSQIFLLVFLPLTVAGFYLAAASTGARIWWLIAVSIVFYGYWDWRLVPLLVGSICVNWSLARLFGAVPRGWLVFAGVGLNLTVLGVFKYADFFAGTLAAAAGMQHESWGIVLPLAISFFTFQQISYLVERGRGAAPDYFFRDYLLYVSFFPQLIAGPIVRHNEIIHQFALSPLRADLFERVAGGLALLTIGLVKKVFVADQLTSVVDPVFAKAVAETSVGGFEAWVGAVGFSLQIYFDFSAYSDMAIGIGLMLGVTLPTNFNAPYKAASIRDFWRRWHMTLSRFLRDYLYIPLGGNRHGLARQISALLVTMLLGGLWHGAGWNFVIWGGLHGSALALNHAWNQAGRQLPTVVGWLLTFLFVIATFVVFRAEDTDSALVILGDLMFVSGSGDLPEAKTAGLLAAALMIALVFPTSQTLALDLLSPRPAFAAIGAAAVVLVLLYVGTGQNAEFIYFQF
jgi:D-alanyl-lipoteichoic acid acyltransferase DltB (MBOAT superfamily)